MLDEVGAARRAELKDDVDLRAGIPRRSVADAQREVVLAIDGERLERLRDRLPDLGAIHEPDFIGAPLFGFLAQGVGIATAFSWIGIAFVAMSGISLVIGRRFAR